MAAYGLFMTTTDAVESQLARNIENQLAARGLTRKSLYDRAGISRNLFERSMAGGRSFSVLELMRIASALGLHVSEILPESIKSPIAA